MTMRFSKFKVHCKTLIAVKDKYLIYRTMATTNVMAP